MRTSTAGRDRLEVRYLTARRPSSFAEEVRNGLSSTPKQLPPRYFYDALGSALFIAITELREYYVTRAETEVLQRYAGEIARAIGPVTRLIELGSGNARKTHLLIDAMVSRQPPLRYQPVDVDAALLESSSREITMRFPSVTVEALAGDYDDVSTLGTISGRTAVLFLGSSIGNLDHTEAAGLLRGVRQILSPGDVLLVGFDLVKATSVIEAAYNDALGVTASFNLNLLARINRELGANFDLTAFAHRAFFNEAESRIEMHLVSRRRQSVDIAALPLEVRFEDGETIHTENSYKYDIVVIESLAAAARLTVERTWTDSQGWFADVLMRV